MSLTSDEQRRRQAALWRAQGMSDEEIARRLARMQTEHDNNGRPLRSGKQRSKPQGKRPDPKRIPFDKLSQPYRFITLPDEVLPPENGPIALDEPLLDGYRATIAMEWIAETPLLIGGAAKPKKKGELDVTEPLAIGGRYVLPGATLRGLIRNAVEIVAHGKMTQGNWHYRFGLRDFVHPYYKDEAGVSKVKEVRAGFLHIRGNKWELTPAKDWGHVEIASLKQVGVSARDLEDGRNKRGDMVPHKGWIEKELKAKYAALGMVEKDRIVFKKRMSFRLLRDENDRRVYAVDPEGSAQGIMLVAGKLPGGGNKRFEYFVAPDPAAQPVRLAPDVVDLFERLHSEPSKGEQLRPAGNWKDLKPASEADGIPVFYVGDPDPEQRDPNFFFGLTRLFKIPHKFSVGKILHDSQHAHEPRGKLHENGKGFSYDNLDFVENLFGHVIEPRDVTFQIHDSVPPGVVARKGRIAFGFAWLDETTPAKVEKPVQVIQMAPRASFAPFYLRGELKDYSGGRSKLAGRKAYFPRYTNPAHDKTLADFRAFGERQKKLVAVVSQRQASADVFSHLSFLVPTTNKPLTFREEIRLHNVTAAEVGAVLYALTHGGDREKRFRHMIGRGKPFGAGQMRVGQICLRVERNLPEEDQEKSLIKAPTTDELFDRATGKGLVTEDSASVAPFLKAFEIYLCGCLKKGSAAELPAIREWLGMADPQEGAKLAGQDRLFYHPFAKDGQDREVAPFQAYRLLREATQAMETPDAPQGADRLLPAPQVKPPSRRAKPL